MTWQEKYYARCSRCSSISLNSDVSHLQRLKMLRILSSVRSAAPVSARFFSASAVAPSKNIFVGNWPFEGTREELTEMFAEFGEIEQAKVPTTFEGQPRGFAFVNYVEASAGEKAIEALNGKRHHDRAIRVAASVPRDPNAPRPSRFGGEQRSHDNRREGYAPRREGGGYQRGGRGNEENFDGRNF